MTENNTLPVWKIVAIGSALFAAQFAWVIYNTYVPLFLQAGSVKFDALIQGGNGAALVVGFGLSAVQTGFIMSLDNIAAFILQPLVGMLSDRTRTRLGRRVPYLVFGMPAAAVGMVLLPLMLPTTQAQHAGLFLAFMAFLLLTVVSMAVWRAPVFALMADLTPSSLRSQANGILNLMAGLGGVLAFILGSLLYFIYRPFPFWAAGFIMVGSCLLIFWSVHEIKQPETAIAAEVLPLKRWFWQWYKALPYERRRSLNFLTLAVFCYMMGFHPIEAFFSSYGVSVLKLSEANSGLVLSAAYISFILCAVPAGILAGRIGRKRTVLIGLVLFAVVLLAAFFTPVTFIMVGLMALGGVGWALVDINGFTMVLDAACGPTTLEVGTATGIYFIATTLAATLGPILNGWLIDLSGRNYSTIFLIGPAFYFLAFLCMLQVHHGEAQR